MLAMRAEVAGGRLKLGPERRWERAHVFDRGAPNLQNVASNVAKGLFVLVRAA
jgi:hypothetical protein